MSCGRYEVALSARERAIMEYLHLVKTNADVEHAHELMAGLGLLRPDVIQTLGYLAAHLVQAYEYAKLVPMYRRIREGYRVHRGPKSRAYAVTCYNLAMALRHTKQYAEAIDFYRETLTIWDEIAPRSLSDQVTRRELGYALARVGEYAEAEKLLLKAIEELEDGGAPHEPGRVTPYEAAPHIVNVRSYLAEVYEGLGRPEEAARWR